MRQSDPLILGAGPAGCAAAIGLARAGADPLLLDRHEQPSDPLCGGFLSWKTTRQLADLGIDCAALGAHRVDRLRLFARHFASETPLPEAAYGLSRHTLDSALRKAAVAAGARFECDRITGFEAGVAHGVARDWRAQSLFLATGKEDLRGHSRPRNAKDPALGLRLRLPPSPVTSALVGTAIELHLFAGGYAGIVLQEDGAANICLALRKSLLARHGGSPAALLDRLGERHGAFGERLGTSWREHAIQTIGAVPYGWRARTVERGLFRLGDQGAVIPSLAGEGIGIALASGLLAARCWQAGGAEAAPAFQRHLAAATRRPLALAGMAWRGAEHPFGADLAALIARLAPATIGAVASATRIALPPALAPRASAA